MSFFIFDFSETGKKLLESRIIISYNLALLQNRSLQQQAQQAPPPSTSFGQYFNNFNGSGGDLPDY